MDDLVALFEQDDDSLVTNDNPSHANNNISNSNNNNSISIQEDDEQVDALLTGGSISDSRTNQQHICSDKQQQKQLQILLGCIRLLSPQNHNKNDNSADADAVSMLLQHQPPPPPHKVVSLATLAAASQATRASYLVESSSTDASGQTWLETCGVVFDVSSSKVSQAQGAAYVQVSLGTLATGPCVSLLLFGAAYQQYMTRRNSSNKRALGQVWWIRQPRLLSSNSNNSNNNMTVTLSLIETDQCVVLGQDRDFGYCQGRASGRNAQGYWVSNLGPCGNVIDRRQGVYCVKHVKQQQQQKPTKTRDIVQQKEGATVTVGTRMDPQQQGERRLTMPTNRSLVAATGGRMHMSSLTQSQLQSQRIMAQLEPMHTQRGLLLSKNQKQTHVVLPPDGKTRAKKATTKSKPGTSHNNTRLSSTTSSSASIITSSGRHDLHATIGHQNATRILNVTNPYQTLSRSVAPHNSHTLTSRASATTGKRPAVSKSTQPKVPPTTHGKKKPPQRQQQQQQQPIVDPLACLHPSKKPKRELAQRNRNDNTSTKRKKNASSRRSLNTDTNGFDGSVPVPQPIQLQFGGLSNAPLANTTCQTSKQQQQQQHEEEDPRDIRRRQLILAKQQELGEQLQQQDNSNKARPLTKTRHNQQSTKNNKPRDRETRLFGELKPEDVQRAAHAQSRFAEQARAQDYVIHRRAVVELERQENAGQNKSKEKNHKNDDNNKIKNPPRIRKEWHCRECAKTYSHPPASCHRQGHTLSRQRFVTAKETLEQSRQAMNKDESGLKLGSGLEWSQWQTS